MDGALNPPSPQPPSIPPCQGGGEKPWWQSKTLWVNALAGALVALEAGTGLLQPLFSANIYAVVAVGLPAINAALRVITKQGVTL